MNLQERITLGIPPRKPTVTQVTDSRAVNTKHYWSSHLSARLAVVLPPGPLERSPAGRTRRHPGRRCLLRLHLADVVLRTPRDHGDFRLIASVTVIHVRV